MTINTALLVILTVLAAFLYAQTRADKARREIARLAAFDQWTSRAFDAARKILLLKDFPLDEIEMIYRIVRMIDNPSTALHLFKVFHEDEPRKDRPTMNEESRNYFKENPCADADYLDFFYSAMMAISYLDNFGDLVRPKIDKMKNGIHHSSADLSEDFKEIGWPAVGAAAA